MLDQQISFRFLSFLLFIFFFGGRTSIVFGDGETGNMVIVTPTPVPTRTPIGGNPNFDDDFFKILSKPPKVKTVGPNSKSKRFLEEEDSLQPEQKKEFKEQCSPLRVKGMEVYRKCYFDLVEKAKQELEESFERVRRKQRHFRGSGLGGNR